MNHPSIPRMNLTPSWHVEYGQSLCVGGSLVRLQAEDGVWAVIVQAAASVARSEEQARDWFYALTGSRTGSVATSLRVAA